MQFRIGDRTISARETKQLVPGKKTVYRLELEEPDSDPIVVKQQKDEWEEEFKNEKMAYERLKTLQSNVIPQFLGQGLFDGVPALFISEIVGTTLYDLAQGNDDVPENILEARLYEAFGELSRHGAVHWDPKLDNFLFCHGESKVMLVDLEHIKFPEPLQPGDIELNKASVSRLMSDFRYAKNPNRPPSPIDWLSIGSMH
jgi:hypothetical protein